ncbi:ribosomal protein S18-alanine N-acetyltransferase [Paucibacter sp. AS339]|uniref:ribosomal protein S18-alanine N-acetyltransferase n=1 Tax=Paucibacter hankyongi TaxID=3133434 RepID=UPI0030A8C6D9
MSALLNAPFERPGAAARLHPMRAADLAEVLAIERAVYALPWTEGNFIDSMAAGYQAFVLRQAPSLRDTRTPLLGYFLAMKGFEEMHLLNISVAAECQGQGLARQMLDALCRICAEQACPQLWLEVRVSNQRARHVYKQYGFSEVGLRRGYYPVLQGPREDACLMSLAVPL